MRFLTLFLLCIYLSTGFCFTKDLFASVKNSLKDTADSLKSSVDTVKNTIEDIVGHIHNSLCNHDKDNQEKDNHHHHQNPPIETFTVEPSRPKNLDENDDLVYDIDVRGNFRRRRHVLLRTVRVVGLPTEATTSSGGILKQMINAPDRCPDGTVNIGGRCRRLIDY